MARSYHNKSGKGSGYEYWGRRPSKMGTSVGKAGGKEIKKHTHRQERRAAKKDKE